MKLLTDIEFHQEIENGTGVIHSLGGTQSKNGKEILLLRGTPYLFNPTQVGGKEWDFCRSLQEIETVDVILSNFNREN